MDLDSDNTIILTERKVTPRTNVYLSLYLVIFGFFVVLVNESDLDVDKSEKALSSVKQTLFANANEGVRAAATVNEVSRAQNDDFQETQNVIGEFLPDAKFHVNAGQNRLRINVPADALFFQNTAAVRSEARDAMAALADQLSQRDGDHQVFITVPRRRGNSQGEPGATAADLRRAQLIAKFLTTGRESAPQVLTGSGRQEDGFVSVTIQTNGAPTRPVL